MNDKSKVAFEKKKNKRLDSFEEINSIAFLNILIKVNINLWIDKRLNILIIVSAKNHYEKTVSMVFLLKLI